MQDFEKFAAPKIPIALKTHNSNTEFNVSRHFSKGKYLEPHHL